MLFLVSLLLCLLYFVGGALGMARCSTLCGLVAATNIESIYSEWSCTTSGNTTTDPCGDPWTGLTCNNDSIVTEIKFSELSNLRGTLPDSLGNCTLQNGCNMVTFQISTAKLSGSLPTALGMLTNLTTLNVSSNSITGPIPDSFGSLSVLFELLIYSNFLTGTLPSQLGSLVLLDTIGVQNNFLTGMLPSEYGSLSSLTNFFGTNNHLTSSIPVSFGSLVKMATFSFDYNILTGTIPDSLGSCKTLNGFWISSNHLSGTLPSSMGSLINMKIILAYGNMFSGSIPSAMGSMTKLYELVIENNFFTGSFPSSFGSLNSLSFLSVSNNQFNGSLNQFTWPLLLYADIADNQFSGSIPFLDFAYESTMDLLVYFDTSYNRFSGSLPSLAAYSLQHLEVTGNSLSGTIPANWATATNLSYINVGSNEGIRKFDLCTVCLDGFIMFWGLTLYIVGGLVPDEFCKRVNLSLSVADTGITCYSGCLTSSAVALQPVYPECHDGSIMRQFLFLTGAFGLLLVASSFAYYRFVSHSKPVTISSGSDANCDPDSSRGLGLWSLCLTVRSTQGINSLVAVALLKLVCVVVVSLTLNNWWSLDNQPGTIAAQCSSQDNSTCHSFCHDVFKQEVNVVDDDTYVAYSSEPMYVTITGHTHPSYYYLARMNGPCAYKYWLIFRLVPLLLHLVHFLLQWASWRYYGDFTPQQQQYNLVLAHLYPEVNVPPPPSAKGTLSIVNAARLVIDSGGSTTGTGTEAGYSGLLRALSGLPWAYNVFSFLDMTTLIWVWGELRYPPVYCGDTYPLSLYYYPLLMSVLELAKFNQYAATVLLGERRPAAAAAALFNIQMASSNLVVSVALFVMFLFPVCGGTEDSLSWPDAQECQDAELGGEGGQATSNPMLDSDTVADATDIMNSTELELRPSQLYPPDI